MVIVLKGLLTGFILSIYIGATFFMLIETSITRGFKSAIWFDMGVLLSDMFCIFLASFFTSWIIHKLLNNFYFNVAGGLAFIGFGVNYLVYHQKKLLTPQNQRKFWQLFIRGFFANLLNPAVMVFWLGAVAVAISRFGIHGRQIFVYFASAMCVVAGFDLLKIHSACWLSNFLKPHVLRWIYIISGILMIGLGLVIIFK